jgi:hypothetical protein
MIELLKKLGLPAGVAAIVGGLVAIMPFIFKLDERYAKASELQAEVTRLNTQVQALTVEVGKMAGIQGVLVALVSPARQPIEVQAEPASPAPVTAPAASRPAAPPLVVEQVVIPEPPKPSATTAEKKQVIEQTMEAINANRRNIEQIQRY